MSTPDVVWPRPISLAVWDEISSPRILIARVARGTPLRVLSDHEGYYRVATPPDGQPGYVIKTAVAESAEIATAEAYAEDREPDWSVEAIGAVASPNPRWPELKRASFGRRVAGALIDSAILTAVVFGLSFVLYRALLPDKYTQSELDEARLTVSVLLFVVLAGYRWLGNSYGGTLGKLIVGVRVINDRTAHAPGPGVGLVRFLFSMLSGLVLGLGYLWAAFDEDGKTWHDKGAGTSVVRR